MKPNASMKRSRSRSNARNQHLKHSSNDSGDQRHDTKVRGNFYQVYEKYVALGREASTGGDRVLAEHYYQHAEHYFRLMREHQRPVASAKPPHQPIVETVPVVKADITIEPVKVEEEEKPKAAVKKTRKRVDRKPQEGATPVIEAGPEITEVVIN